MRTIHRTARERNKSIHRDSRRQIRKLLLEHLESRQLMAVINGSAKDDILNGTGSDDEIYGFAGADILNGKDGNDTILGGLGRDSISGGNGSDLLNGGADDDSISGGAGADTIWGEMGADTIDGGDGNDLIKGYLEYPDANSDDPKDLSGDALRGGNGNDTIRGGAGNDLINGDAGSDLVYGGLDDDTIFGGIGNDDLYGGTVDNRPDDGKDTISGGDGDDRLSGGYAIDVLAGDNGNDSLTGGPDRDYFAFSRADIGVDSITDFVPGVDKIRLAGFSLSELPSLNPTQAGNNVSLAFSATSQAMVWNQRVTDPLAIAFWFDVTSPYLFAGGPYSVQENTGAGTPIGTFSIADPNSDTGVPKYSILSGNVNNAFRVEAIPGTTKAAIVVNNSGALDFETNRSFTLLVSAVSGNPVSYSSNAQIYIINLTDVNEAPSIVADEYNSLEDTLLSVGAPGVMANDGNTPGRMTSAQLVSAPSFGTLQFREDGSFSYQPPLNWNGETSFSYYVTDGPSRSETSQVRLRIVGVNDAPVGSDFEKQVTSGNQLVYQVSDFTFSDPMDSPPDQLQSIRIDSTPNRGQLKLNGIVIVAGATVPIADIAAGRLTYDAAEVCAAHESDTFLFSVGDSGGTANGGQSFDLAPNTARIIVLAKPPAPSYVASAVVSGTASLYQALQGPSTTSPVTVQGLPLSQGNVLTFTATGTTSHNGWWFGSDANGLPGIFTYHKYGTLNGISDMNAPVNSLVGVFVGNEDPYFQSIPLPRDYAASGSMNYASVLPKLRQPFFIGTGTNADGSPRSVIVPPGATRLVLGSQDGSQWENNAGNFQVSVWESPPTTGFIRGSVFYDSNQNTVRDTGESAIAQHIVYLDLNLNGLRDGDEPNQITDSDGRFLFAGLTSGTYRLRESVPSEWKRTTEYFDVQVVCAGDYERNLGSVLPNDLVVTGPDSVSLGQPALFTASGSTWQDYSFVWRVKLGDRVVLEQPGSTQLAFTPTVEGTYLVSAQLYHYSSSVGTFHRKLNVYVGGAAGFEGEGESQDKARYSVLQPMMLKFDLLTDDFDFAALSNPSTTLATAVSKSKPALSVSSNKDFVGHKEAATFDRVFAATSADDDWIKREIVWGFDQLFDFPQKSRRGLVRRSDRSI